MLCRPNEEKSVTLQLAEDSTSFCNLMYGKSEDLEHCIAIEKIPNKYIR